jgi:hypothetical protein
VLHDSNDFPDFRGKFSRIWNHSAMTVNDEVTVVGDQRRLARTLIAKNWVEAKFFQPATHGHLRHLHNFNRQRKFTELRYKLRVESRCGAVV